MKRRQFLFSFGLGSLASTRIALAQRPQEAAAAIPPGSPIAQLKSRRAEAIPIAGEERKARIEKAQR